MEVVVSSLGMAGLVPSRQIRCSKWRSGLGVVDIVSKGLIVGSTGVS